MVEPVTINLRHVARGMSIPLKQVQVVVSLLDDGNTVPFITRYRKDETGGLDEVQIRQILTRLNKLRLLAERKQTILRSIEAQGKLTPELEKKIRLSGTTKRLEDLYLPYKPKKQTLATAAKNKGLEPLALEILSDDPACRDLDARAASFISEEKGITTAADAITGAAHILAEIFSENAELRQHLRELVQRSAKIVTVKTEEPKTEESVSGDVSDSKTAPEKPSGKGKSSAEIKVAGESVSEKVETAAENDVQTGDSIPNCEINSSPSAEDSAVTENSEVEVLPEVEYVGMKADTEISEDAQKNAECINMVIKGAPVEDLGDDDVEVEGEFQDEYDSAETDLNDHSGFGGGDGDDSEPENPSSEILETVKNEEQSISDTSHTENVGSADVASPSTSSEDGVQFEPKIVDSAEFHPELAIEPMNTPLAKVARAMVTKPIPIPLKAIKQKRKQQKALKRKKEEERKNKAYQDYFSYQEAVRKIPPHRVLAINRGERAHVLRVKIEVENDALMACAEEVLHFGENTHTELLRNALRDALNRLVMPSLERETRRELTERAETHAVEVFARNLRNLLLQSPVHDRRVLAVDPGFKNGCKLAALDQFGNVLGHQVMYLVGKPERLEETKKAIINMVDKNHLSVVVIGNGTACRSAEEFFSEMLGKELAGRDMAYVIVNEAGASVYSTSTLGREEFPEYDATLRGAISIGRRLQDPLSEMVKIDPANIGVGLYQHDVKAKHLRESLESVVESCVNYVGVDVNTASPALLRFVSGLNQLHARKIFEYRRANGPFRNREQLKNVSGIGETTYIQAAGFLKINRGDNALDSTWIHPESYELAERILEKLGSSVEDLRSVVRDSDWAEKVMSLDVTALASELNTGEMKLRDIMAQLIRPGRDPREDLPQPIFKKGVLNLDDLTEGLELTGTVLNVVDFGAFVDIGMHDSGLVHVSQMADKFIRDPHEVVTVGDVVKIWVVGVDKERRRVSLTMIDPSLPRKSQEEFRSRGGSGNAGRESSGSTSRGSVRSKGVARTHSLPVPPSPVGLRLVSEAPSDYVPSSEKRGDRFGRGDSARDNRSEKSHGGERREGRRDENQDGRRGGVRRDGDRFSRERGRGDGESYHAGTRGSGMQTNRRDQSRYQYKPREVPKVVAPITEEMRSGRTPMRSFTDLMQFFQKDTGEQNSEEKK